MPSEQVSRTPHLLCVEVLSPEDRLSRTTKVLDDFASMGVENLWIIDLIERVAYIYQPGGKLQFVTDRLAIPESPIYLDLPSLFAALDEHASAADCAPFIAPLPPAMSGTAHNS